MKKPVFSGSGVALVTPMDSEGRVNELVLCRLIESQIEQGTDAVILCGTTGEAPTLDDGSICRQLPARRRRSVAAYR